MKKILALLLAAMMTLSLAACGSDTGSTDEDSGDTAGQDTAEPSADDDFAYIQGNGSMKIGFTYFEPMNYMDDNGEFVGFETEFATAVCEKLGVEPEFVEINWDSKVMELESKNIDCIWNGMTITPELEEALTISDPYIKNYQVVVIRADNADTYTTTADLVGKTVEAEAGSAGETAISEDENLSQATYVSVTKQTDALLEVKGHLKVYLPEESSRDKKALADLWRDVLWAIWGKDSENSSKVIKTAPKELREKYQQIFA